MDNINNCNICNDFGKTLKFASLGGCLRQARETMGLSQQNIAKSLCLKLSIIKNIEEGYLDQLEISSIFLYGYIRSYARLVGVDSEKIIDPILYGLNPVFSVRNKRKFEFFHFLYRHYREKTRLLMILGFIFCICVMVVVFTMCDLKYYFFKEPYSNSLSSRQAGDFFTNFYSKNSLIFFSENNIVKRSSNVFFNNICYDINGVKHSSYFIDYFPEVFDKLLNGIKYYSLYKDIIFSFSNDIYVINDIHNLNDNDHTLAMSFISDCWIEIFDASGKRLYVGTQHIGDFLNIRGEIPYKLTIGAPQSIQIKYRGRVVSLEKFIYPYKVARISIP